MFMSTNFKPNLFFVTRNRLAFLGILFYLFLFFISSLFNPDPHHDGIVFFYGSQVTGGSLPNRDFYSQWGPIYSLIVSIPLFFSNELYSLRVFQGLSLIALFVIFFMMARRVLPKKFAYLGFILFTLSYPGLIDMGGDQRYPAWQAGWPNLYGFILIASSTLVFLNYYNREFRKRQPYYLILIVCLLNLSFYVRVNFIFLVITISLAYFFLIFKKTKTFHFPLQFIFYTLSFHFVALGVMFFTNSLNPWLEQNIADPLQYSSLGLYGNLGFSWIIESLIFNSTLILILLSIAWMRNKYGARNVSHIFVVLLMSGLILLTKLLNSVAIFHFPNRYSNLMAYLLGDIHLSFLALALVITLVFPIFILRKNRKFNSEIIVLYSGAIGSLGLLHNLNLDYVWLNSFFIYLFLIRLLVGNSDRRELRIDVLKTSVLIVVICLSLSVISNVGKTWGSLVFYKSSPVSRMISTDTERAFLITENLKLFRKIPNIGSVVSLCPDLLYEESRSLKPESLFERGIIKEQLLNKGESFPTFLFEADYVFICDLSETEFYSLESRIESRAIMFAVSEVGADQIRSAVLKLISN